LAVARGSPNYGVKEDAMTNPWLKLSGIGLAALLGLGAPAVALADDDAGARFKAMDTNGDGKISEAEHESSATAKFDTMDSNRDGRVTATEMDAFKANTHKDKKAAKGWSTTYWSADRVKKLDTNGDGSLTIAEFQAGANTKFAEMDTNKDGFLSKSEVEAGYAKMQGKAAGK
jgi:Ca2+-binding EF-hand superfamily protein